MNIAIGNLEDSMLASEAISLVISFFSIITLVFGLYYIIRSYNYFYKASKYSRERDDKIEKEFIKAMQEGLKKEIAFSERYILQIYEAIIQPDYTGPDSYDKITSLLKKFLLYLSSGEKTEKISDELIKEWSQIISEYIGKFEKESPYSDLTDAERSILIDMHNFAENNDHEAIKRKISEIARIIRVRTSDMNQMAESNKRANLYAKIGIVLTILFGIISLVLTLDRI
jgi:hypothetical protein